MAKLILVRHGQSEWNLLGKWTGHTDVALTEQGDIEARRAGAAIQGIPIAVAYSSPLKRARQTFDAICKELLLTLPVVEHPALLERHYGIFTGKNKWEIKQQIGDEAFMAIRRGWDAPIEGGESLKQVHQRVLPYYLDTILPHIKAGKNTLVVAHGNSLRSLAKYLENISDEDISHFEIGIGEVLCYDLDSQGTVREKTVYNSSEAP